METDMTDKFNPVCAYGDDGSPEASMFKHPYGKYVLYSDYEAKEAELAAKDGQIESLTMMLAAVRDDAMRTDNEMCSMEARAERAESALAEARKALVIANANLDNMGFLSVEGFIDWQQEHRGGRRELT